MSFLTFDIGTTALKTALVGDDGAVRAVHVEEYLPRAPQPGWAEMSPQTYWQAACAGARAVLAASPEAPVAAIGLSSQGQSFLPLDPQGRPLREVLVWVDHRAEAIAARWEASWLPAEKYARLSGYPRLVPELTLFKLAWLAEHEPPAHRAARFLCLPDYLLFRLSGEFATDYNIAQMTGLFDLRAQAWSPELLAAAGITAAQLPEVLPPGTVAGALQAAPAAELGLPPGVPVCVGCNDQLAGALGAGNVHPGLITETTGTALAVLATLEELPDRAALFLGRHAVPDLFYAMSYETTSAIVLTWLRDLCLPGTDYADLLAEAASAPVGSDGLTVLPHFCGASFPQPNAWARGAFLGLGLHHTRGHLVRAILEACACLLRDCLEPVRAAGLQGERVRSLGGAARSDLWLQIKADLLGLPVERPATTQAASLGAAMLAAVGTGHFATLPEAAAAWYRTEREFLPQAGTSEQHREIYRRYRDWYTRLWGS